MCAGLASGITIFLRCEELAKQLASSVATCTHSGPAPPAHVRLFKMAEKD